MRVLSYSNFDLCNAVLDTEFIEELGFSGKERLRPKSSDRSKFWSRHQPVSWLTEAGGPAHFSEQLSHVRR